MFNRRSAKLRQKRIVNPADLWIRKDGAFKGIVRVAKFLQAQKVVESRSYHLSDEQMLDHLRWLQARVGKLTAKVINADIATPCVATFQRRFVNLVRAYKLIGYKPAGTTRASHGRRRMCATQKCKATTRFALSIFNLSLISASGFLTRVT